MNLSMKNRMNKRLLPLLTIVLVWTTGCGPNLEEIVVDTWPDGSPQKVEYYEKSGKKSHKVKEVLYHENGRKEMEGGFVDGKKEGMWVAWFEDGAKQSEGFYQNDLRHGKSLVWRNDGMKYYEGFYSMGKLHGKWIFYDTDGTPNKEVHFEHDQKIREIDYKAEGNR